MNEVAASQRAATDDNNRIASAISVLPDECLMNIFRFVLSDCDIPPPDVVITGHYTLAYVCRQWWALSQDDILWHLLCNDQGYSRPLDRTHWSFKKSYLWHWRIHQNWLQGRWRSHCRLEGHSDYVSFVFSTLPPKASIVDSPFSFFSCSHDGWVREWRFDPNSVAPAETIWLKKAYQGHTDVVSTLRVNDTYIVSCSRDRNLIVWDRNSGERKYILSGHRSAVTTVTLHEHIAVSASYDSDVRVWDLTTGQCRHVLKGNTDWVWVLHLDTDSGYIISGCDDRVIRIWDTDSGKMLEELKGHAGPVTCIQLVGDTLVSGSVDGTLQVWKPQSFKPPHHTTKRRRIETENEREKEEDEEEREKNAEEEEISRCRVHVLEGHEDGVTCLHFVGSFLASGSADGTVRLWSVETGECVRVFNHPLNPEGPWRDRFLWNVRLSPHLDFLVNTMSILDGVAVWETLADTTKYTVTRPNSTVVPSHVSTLQLHGNFLLCGYQDGCVAVFDFTPQDEYFKE